MKAVLFIMLYLSISVGFLVLQCWLYPGDGTEDESEHVAAIMLAPMWPALIVFTAIWRLGKLFAGIVKRICAKAREERRKGDGVL